MALKEGVTNEQVAKFNQFLELVKSLQSKIYEGAMTLDEALDQVIESIGTFEGIKLEDPKVTKKGKMAKGDHE